MPWAGVPDEIRQRQLEHLTKADPAYGAGVAKALGLELAARRERRRFFRAARGIPPVLPDAQWIAAGLEQALGLAHRLLRLARSLREPSEGTTPTEIRDETRPIRG